MLLVLLGLVVIVIIIMVSHHSDRSEVRIEAMRVLS